MTHTPASHTQPRRSRRRMGKNGLPHLASQLPKDFRSATNVNAFVYSLTVEVTAGRVEARTAAVLGYLTQLAIQTLPHIEREAQLTIDAGPSAPFKFITHIPRPEYPVATSETTGGDQQ